MTDTNDKPDLLLTDEEVSVQLRVTPATLATWRNRKKGPPWIKVGGFVRYRQSDLDNYLVAQTRDYSQQAV